MEEWMTHRERVLAALGHEHPDRVPVDLGATRDSTATQEFYQKLKAHFGLTKGPGFDVITSRMMRTVEIDEPILLALDIDTRGVGEGTPDAGGVLELPDDSYRDEWGVVRRRPVGSYYYDLSRSPLSGGISLNDIVTYAWPNPDDPGRTRGLWEQVNRWRQSGDYAIVLNLPAGFVHVTQYLRGFEDWFVDMALQPDLIGALMDAVLEVVLSITSNMLDAVGQEVDVIFASDDLGAQNGTIVSPEAYRKIIKPRQRFMFDFIHDHTDAPLVYHTCGSVYDILPDLIEIGVNAINPVQVSAAKMDTARLKREFGDDLAFWGAIDTQHVLPHGSVADVKAEVRRRIADLDEDGGYILASVHNVQPDVPVENLLAMVEAARESM